MSYAPALDAYAFDVAVSFASEDREFVGEIVSQLTASNARVFCDSDFSAGIRGEELPGHLDRIYRRKTPHAVIFVSRFYAEKMWVRYERRAVITGAHDNSGIHILAVRLDDTSLPGLRPAIGCLDARWVGLAGIAEAILARLVIMRAGRAETVTRVPRTEAESQQLLMTRPTGWEFLHFAARLLRERAAVEGKYRDFVMGYAPPTDEVICIEDAPDFISRAVRYAMQRTRNLNRVISPAVQEGAFGRPGEDGDAEAIRHMAMRLNSIYEDLIDWTARVRGATLPAEFAGVVELLGHVGGRTISAYRKFVDTFVAQNDQLPEQIAMGKPMTPDLTVTFSIPDETVEAIRAELRRVAEVFGRRPRPDSSRAGAPGTAQLRPAPPPPPPRLSHIANGNGNAIQLGQHGIDGLIQDQGWRRIHSAARNSLAGPRCGWSAVRAKGHGRTRRRRPGRPHGPR
jgi:TIR domain-containing protein